MAIKIFKKSLSDYRIHTFCAYTYYHEKIYIITETKWEITNTQQKQNMNTKLWKCTTLHLSFRLD